MADSGVRRSATSIVPRLPHSCRCGVRRWFLERTMKIDIDPQCISVLVCLLLVEDDDASVTDLAMHLGCSVEQATSLMRAAARYGEVGMTDHGHLYDCAYDDSAKVIP